MAKPKITPSKAVKMARGKAALGRLFDPPVSRQAVQHWVARKAIPARRQWELFDVRPEWFI